MTLEGVADSENSEPNKREQILHDYHKATRTVDRLIDFLTDKIRSKRINRDDVHRLAKDLYDVIDEIIGKHPVSQLPEFKDDAKHFKNDVYTAIESSIGTANVIKGNFPIGDQPIDIHAIAKLLYKSGDLAPYVDLDGHKTQLISISECEIKTIPVVHPEISDNLVNNTYGATHAIIAYFGGIALAGIGWLLEKKGLVDIETSKNIMLTGVGAVATTYISYAAHLLTGKRNKTPKPQIRASKPEKTSPSLNRRLFMGTLATGALTGLMGGAISDPAIPPKNYGAVPIRDIDPDGSGIYFPKNYDFPLLPPLEELR